MTQLTPSDIAAIKERHISIVEWTKDHQEWAKLDIIEKSNLIETVEAQAKRIGELEGLINTPEIDDWFSGVRLESAHQQERWGAEGDAGKTPWDWFWLIGYLAQKAAASALSGDAEKAKHHTISTAAAMLNWHRVLNGESLLMRPGIEPPQSPSDKG